MVLTSSAAAAPPAYAWPRPLAFCSCSANAAPNAWPADNDNNATPTAAASRVRRNPGELMLYVLLSVGAAHSDFFGEAPRACHALPVTIHALPRACLFRGQRPRP